MRTARRSTPAYGFTLIELAIVLAIIALLIGAMLFPLAGQMDYKNRLQTEKDMASIQEALLGFAAANGRLPCPADPTLADGSAGAGEEATITDASVTPNNTQCACGGISRNQATTVAKGGVSCRTTLQTVVSGVLPWATLGAPETDAWNRRFTYKVTTLFARSVNQPVDPAAIPAPLTDASGYNYNCPSADPTKSVANPAAPSVNAAIALCSRASLEVLSTRTPVSPAVQIAGQLPAVLISHGKNGNCANLTNGAFLPTPPVANQADADQLMNCISTAANNVVSNIATDDLVQWISPAVLINRMIATGKLP